MFKKKSCFNTAFTLQETKFNENIYATNIVNYTGILVKTESFLYLKPKI